MDAWNTKAPTIETLDLPPRDDSLPVKLSILMSINNFRRGQLARSLECLCRQNWQEFEVLVCDNGSPEHLEDVFEIFDPLLRLKTVRLERTLYSACPTRGLRALFPEASGDVWAIMQPEIMLHPNMADYLHDAHFGDVIVDTHSYKISTIPVSAEGLPRWVVVKPGFFSAVGFSQIDRINWHMDLKGQIENLPGFWSHNKGFSYATNRQTLKKLEYPWWFVGSALKDAGIWEDMPEFGKHASVDQWLLSYRNHHEYLDITTRGLGGYHQWHTRGSQDEPAPEPMDDPVVTEEERASWLPMEIDELRGLVSSYVDYLVDAEIEITNDLDFDSLWKIYEDARAWDRETVHRGTPVFEQEYSVRVQRMMDLKNSL